MNESLQDICHEVNKLIAFDIVAVYSDISIKIAPKFAVPLDSLVNAFGEIANAFSVYLQWRMVEGCLVIDLDCY